MELKLKRPLAIFDLESTGANIATDRIIQIYILKVMPDGTTEEYEALVNPKMPISPEAITVHGITDADVADAPAFWRIGHDIEKFLEGCDIGGYNSNRFDIPLLLEEFYRMQVNFDLSNRKMVDVFKIFIKMEGRDLASAVKFYCNKEIENAHDAKGDVIATYDVLKAQLDRYPETLMNDVDFLHDFTYDSQYLDSGRRFIMENGVAKFNFGKHKGKTVEDVLRQEPQYYDWMIRSDFLHDTKQKFTDLRNKFLDAKKEDK